MSIQWEDHRNFAEHAESRGERPDELSVARAIIISAGIGFVVLAALVFMIVKVKP